MGLLDDAIRQHLELKRAHGADEAELQRKENEALGPVRREAEPAPEAAAEAPAAPEEAPPVAEEPVVPPGGELPGGRVSGRRLRSPTGGVLVSAAGTGSPPEVC